MARAEIPKVSLTNPSVKRLFPFEYGLRSNIDQGTGARNAINARCNADGHVEKTEGTSIFAEVEDIQNIIEIFEIESGENSEKMFVFYKVGDEDYRTRIITDGVVGDEVEISTGGVMIFKGEQFDSQNIGGTFFVSNNRDDTPLYKFNGTAFEKTANVSEKVLSISSDGNRLAICYENRVDFSGDDIVDSNDAQSGTGVNRWGTYGVTISFPKALCNSGSGVIVFGQRDAEAHQVSPNAASDDVSSKTKLNSFSYKGLGVLHPSQCVAGDTFIYFGNEKFIAEMNPFSGESNQLTSRGSLNELFKSVKKNGLILGYDADNKFVCANVQRVAQNDLMICFDVGQSGRPCWTSQRQNNNCFTSVGGKIFAGSSMNGQVYELFSSTTNIDGTNQLFVYETEKDSLGGAEFLKTFRKIVVYCELHPKSTFITKVRINDNEEPIFEKEFGVPSVPTDASNISDYGKYVFSLGKVDIEKISNTIRLSQKTARFNRISIEISENSAQDFKLKGIVIEYKARGRYVRKYLSKNI